MKDWEEASRFRRNSDDANDVTPSVSDAKAGDGSGQTRTITAVAQPLSKGNENLCHYNDFDDPEEGGGAPSSFCIAPYNITLWHFK